FHAIPPEGTRLSFAARSASLPEGFVAVESAGVTNDGWPQRIRCEADGAEMAFVPGGTFLIGLKGQSDHALPAHPVDLDPYYIDVTEVTLGQYRKFMDAMLDERRLIPPPVNDGAAADHPVLGVEWGEVIRYARWAGKS